MMLVLAITGLATSLLPAVMFLKNLPLFLFPMTVQHQRNSGTGDAAQDEATGEIPGVSVLIPARDEEDGISASVQAALQSRGVAVEVLVLDDNSTDQTAVIVKRLSLSESRVRYQLGGSLPVGWNGKQFACTQLAASATHQTLVFMDADVRLKPDALRRLVECRAARKVGLLSVFPHQETGTILEKLIIPLMHFILLGFCPLDRMRGSSSPSLAAGCGQLFLTTAEAYEKAGTHAAIRGSRHDGVKLPRAFRAVGLMTDVYDGSEMADCRMYHSAVEVVRGVLKNATEGLANPKLILPFSLFLIGGSVLPLVVLVFALCTGNVVAALVSGLAVFIGHFPRALAAAKLRQPVLGVVCHAPATLLFVGLQWVALLNQLMGWQVAWRGRTSS